MNKRWLINVILVIAIAILSAVVLLQPGVEKPVKKERISTIADTEISRITIEHSKAPAIVLARKGEDDWQLVKPRGPHQSVHGVGNTKDHPRTKRATPAGRRQLNLERYGLASPKGRIQYDDHVLAFGDTNPVNNQQYVLLDNRVHMIDHRYYQAVSRTYIDFLSRQLIESGRKPVKLKLPGLTLAVVKGSWQVTPAKPALASDRIKQLADDWQHAQALYVKPYEKVPVQNWVTLWFAPEKGGDRQTTLRVGIVSRTPELVLYRPDEGLQYHFPQDLNRRLLSFEN